MVNYIRGEKTYELSNHLGNVLATISDRKIPEYTAGINSPVAYYKPDITSYSDYYPFGSPITDRSLVNSNNYRYGFNGMEMDDEMHSQSGTSYDFGARMYDSRLGKFISVDPRRRDFANLSPYAFAGNNPIMLIDEEGEGPGYAALKFLAQMNRGTFAVSITSNVSLGAVATAAKGMAVDKQGNVALFYTFGGLANTDSKGPSFSVGGGMTIGAKATPLPGINDVRALKGDGVSLNGSVGPTFGQVSASLEAGAGDEVIGWSIGVAVGPNIGNLSLEVTKTTITAMTGSDYEKIDDIASTAWSERYSDATSWNKKQKQGVWEPGASKLEYVKVQGEENRFEAVISTKMMFKSFGKAKDTNFDYKQSTGVFFSKDKKGNLTSENLNSKK